MRIIRPVWTLLAVGALSVPAVLAQDGQRAELKPAGWGSLRGIVTLKGAVPAPANVLAAMTVHADAPHCLAGNEDEKIDRTWVVDKKTGGVANVGVWLKPPAGSYFPVRDTDRRVQGPAVIDVPHCAFMPYTTAAFTHYFDGTKLVPTGQNIVFKNSAKVAHCVHAATDPRVNRDFNIILDPGKEAAFSPLPQRLPIRVTSDVHPWMRANLFVFDSPYFALTKGDGSFVIPRVPAGVEVRLMAYHEGVGWVLGKDGQGVTLRAGENVRDFQVEPRAEK